MRITSLPAPLPDNEARRLRTLHDYQLLDTPREELFDAFTRLAARICGTPISLISLIDQDRQWFKSNFGLPGVLESPRETAFCAHAILGAGIFEIPDATKDERFAHNPAVEHEPGIRFYAGVPLVTMNGDALGTLCVLDLQPRRLSADQSESLHAIASAILEQFEARRAMLRLFERSQTEVYHIDVAAQRVVYASESARRNLGYGLAELQTLPLERLLPALGRDVARAAQLRDWADRRLTLRSTAHRKNGTSYPLELRVEIMQRRDGGDVALVFGTDVSTQVAAAERIEELSADATLRGLTLELQNERLTSLTSIARGIFAALEPRALVDALVAGVRELSGGTCRVVAAGPNGGFAETCDLTFDADAPEVDDAFLRSAAHSDVTSISPDGRRAAVRILSATGAPAYLLDVRSGGDPFVAADVFAFGLLGQYVAVAVRNAELYGELAARRAAVIELNVVKNDLITMLAHDFKGPLTTIVGFADVLAQDERFDAESRGFLGMISASAMRLAGLATDTLALSRLEQNELTLELDRVDVVALVRDVARVFRVTRTIDVRADAAEMWVVADAERLRQVFENVVGNAIKYSPGGESVEVTLRRRDDGVTVSVRDRGIGIPAADVPKLFGRFARAANARARGIGGTGFGLYLAKLIVEMHGGEIAVESTDTSGTTFGVFVPVTPPPRRDGHRRIVLLDTEIDARSYVGHSLRAEGYAVHAVTDEAELLRALDEGRYDAAVVDAARLGDNRAGVIAHAAGKTALVLLGMPDAGTPAEAHAQLAKPFLVKDLHAAVAAATARHAARGEASSVASSAAGSA